MPAPPTHIGSDGFSYAYDLVNLVSATYPGQPAVSYAYDDDERAGGSGGSKASCAASRGILSSNASRVLLAYASNARLIE